MRTFIAIVALVLSVITSQAATVTGSLRNILGVATDKTLVFSPLDAPFATGIYTITPTPTSVASSSGVFTVDLNQGSYRVSIDGQSIGFIRVPSGSASYNINALWATFTYLQDGGNLEDWSAISTNDMASAATVTSGLAIRQRRYATLALALAGTHSDGDVIYIESRTGVSIDPEFAGEFRYVAASATSTNLGTVFTYSTGRLLRQYFGALNAKWFGATGDGTTADLTALQAAVTTAEAAGGAVVFLPPATYVGGILNIIGTNVTLSGYGATLVNTRIAVGSVATNIVLEGFRIYANGSDTTQYHLNISGQDVLIKDVRLEETNAGAGYQGYLRYTSAYVTLDNVHTSGSNGFYVEGHDHTFINCKLKGSSDDAIAVKALNGPTYNIAVTGGTVERHGAIISLGSEVGVLGAAGDYSQYIRNVVVSGVTALNCNSLLYIKPGAIEAYDYRSGLVEQVVMTGCALVATNGVGFQAGVLITAGRDAIVRDIRVSDCVVHARARANSITSAGIYVYLPDLGNGGIITNITVSGLSVRDTFAGAANDGTHPGYPIDLGIYVDAANVAHATNITDLFFDHIYIDGTEGSGVSIASGITGPVTISNSRFNNLCADSGNGITANSNVRVLNSNITVPGGRKVMDGVITVSSTSVTNWTCLTGRSLDVQGDTMVSGTMSAGAGNISTNLDVGQTITGKSLNLTNAGLPAIIIDPATFECRLLMRNTANTNLFLINAEPVLGATLGTQQSEPLSFRTYNTERMWILAGGNVGIRTNNPSAELEVLGDAKFSGSVTATSGVTFGDGTTQTTAGDVPPGDTMDVPYNNAGAWAADTQNFTWNNVSKTLTARNLNVTTNLDVQGAATINSGTITNAEIGSVQNAAADETWTFDGGTEGKTDTTVLKKQDLNPVHFVTSSTSASNSWLHLPNALSNLVATATVASGGAVTLTNSDTAAASLTINGPASGTNDLISANSGNTNRFKVTEAGAVNIGSGGSLSIAQAGYGLTINSTAISRLNAGVNLGQSGAEAYFYTGISLPEAHTFRWNDNTAIYRHAANSLRLGNGTNAQGFLVSGTYSDASNYRWLKSTMSSLGAAAISAEGLGTGATGNTLTFGTDGTNRWQVSELGHLLASTDNAWDIGASGANRPRNAYISGNLFVGGTGFRAAAGGYYYWEGRSTITSPADGVIRLTDTAETSFSRLQFGGTTASFPSLKRSGTGLISQLADDSAPTWFGATRQVLAKTTNYTVLTADTLAHFSNEGTTSMTTNTLPAAVAGLTYTGIVQDADGMMLLAVGDDTIRVAATVSGAAGNVSSSTIGNVVTLTAINATEWFATSYVGTWTVSAP